MDWMLNSFLTGLFEAVSAIEVANEEAVLAYMKLYHQLCKSLGQHFTVNRIKPIFKEGLRHAEDSFANNLDDSAETPNLPSLAVIPVIYIKKHKQQSIIHFFNQVLLVSVLTTGDPHDTMELSSTLRHLLMLLPSLKLPLAPLKVIVFNISMGLY
jgi:hypothetical protein